MGKISFEKMMKEAERVMDMPIYLHFLDAGSDAETDVPRPPAGPRRRWYVIEENIETAADDELGEQLLINGSPKDRVRRLYLPHLIFNVQDAVFAVSKSRLFFAGGYTAWRTDEGIADNGILHIDLEQQHDLRWERFHHCEDINFAIQAAASEDGNSIYVVAVDSVYRFPCHNVERVISYPPPPDWPRLLLAMSGSNMLGYTPGPWEDSNGPCEGSNGADCLFYYNVENRSLKIIKSLIPSGPIFEFDSCMPSVSCRSVLVRDLFLVYFGFESPCPKQVRGYGPALYVYDISRREWLPEPVRGLEKNGIVFPSSETGPDFIPFLMQVRRDALKLAIVWSVCVDDTPTPADVYRDHVREHTEVHWSKFTLSIHEEDNKPPTFWAACVSSGTFSGGKTILVNCAAG